VTNVLAVARLGRRVQQVIGSHVQHGGEGPCQLSRTGDMNKLTACSNPAQGDAEGPGTAWETRTWGKFCRPDEATSCGPGVAPARDRGSFGRWAAESAHVRPLCPHSPGAFPVFFVIVGQPRRIAPQMTHDDVRECGQRGLAGLRSPQGSASAADGLRFP
jgi:hypothetical protein